MELLISPIDVDFFYFPEELTAEMLRPISTPSKPIEGWGTHRIEALGCEIAFSDEPMGFQVIFEPCRLSEAEAEALVDEIRRNIERVTGERGRVTWITGKDPDEEAWLDANE
ncbi:MAG TPA: hypothetical protein VFR81_10260 [Longimicrobium sp.]|nr:hypothetical protein [Longimicrobium sp.]